MDFISDNNPRPLYTAVLALGDLPGYVLKQATFEPSDVEDLARDAFADMSARELPIHTKTATYLSAVDYYFRGAKRPGAEERIKRAASHYGIADDVAALSAAADAYFSAPEPVQAYAVMADHAKLAGMEPGPAKGLYPVGTVASMLDSADTAAADYAAGRLPMHMFREASLNFGKLASAVGVEADLPPSVRRMGADRLPDFDTALSVASVRKLAGVVDETRDIYVDLVKESRAEYMESGRDPAVLDRWIRAWVELDKGQGVKYSHLVLNPYEAFFSGPGLDEVEKLAKTTVLVGGVLVPAIEFASVPEQHMRSRFAPAMAEELMGLQKQAAYDPAGASLAIEKLDDDIRRRLLRVLASS